MNWRHELKYLIILVSLFLGAYFLPVGSTRFDSAVTGSLELVKWYAREHVILCLVPAFFIAGAIAVFAGKASVIRYLGARANKVLAYGVASVSGSVLAVCSCTVLPLFAGIYRMGAGLGPATTFLYAGPAINVLALILTARVLGLELGIARAIGAIVFSIVLGIVMSFLFRKEEIERSKAEVAVSDSVVSRPLWQNTVYFALLVGILVFANWSQPDGESGLWSIVYSNKWMITAVIAAILGLILVRWFQASWWKIALVAGAAIISALLFPTYPLVPFVISLAGVSIVAITSQGELAEWSEQTWGFAKQILPLLFAGVLVAGLLLGKPGGEGIIPASWISNAVGGNSLTSNLLASVAGAFMYFATLTEVPILQGLMENGMGKGPALALLLAGPALSLPNMLVIRSVLGTKKTVVFILLVILMATSSGMIFGALQV